MNSFSSFDLIMQLLPIVAGMLSICFIFGLLFYRVVMYCSIICFICLLFLLRNPERACNAIVVNPLAMVAPADGKIVAITHAPDNSLDGYCYKVSIVTSFFDAHINRIMSRGVIQQVAYNRFCLIPYWSHEPVYNDIVVVNEYDCMYKIRHVSKMLGAYAACWVKENDPVHTGQSYGLQLLCSRCDIFMPSNVSLCIGIGQHVYAGSTPIGYWLV